MIIKLMKIIKKKQKILIMEFINQIEIKIGEFKDKVIVCKYKMTKIIWELYSQIMINQKV